MKPPKATWKQVRPVEIRGPDCALTLSDGSLAFCDSADVELVQNHNWSPSSKKGHPKSGLGYLAHVILGTPAPGFMVDHIDRDPRNNRRANLRFVTAAQNCRNRSKGFGRSSSFKGVSFRKDRGTWLASIRVEGRLVKIGTFVTELEAARAYDEAARIAFGKFAVLNFEAAA